MANRALYHLRVRQTFDDKKRSAIDAHGLLGERRPHRATSTRRWWRWRPARSIRRRSTQPTHALFHARTTTACTTRWLALHAEGRTSIRLQINFLHNQGFIRARRRHQQLPELRERLKNQFQFFGDEMMRTGGIGEWAAPFAAPTDANGYAVWYEAQRLVAQARWRNENAQAGSPTAADASSRSSPTYEEMDAEFGIKDLRWGLQHADFATASQLARLKALNCGVVDVRLPLDRTACRAPTGCRSARCTRRSSPAASTPACTRTACTSRRTTRGSRCTTRRPA